MKRPAVYFILFSLSIWLTVQTVFGGIVALDPTFNGTGYRIQQINNDGAQGTSVAIRPDGMIFVGGYGVTPSGNYDGFAAMSVNPNGTLNTNFDMDGSVITNLEGQDRSWRVLIQPDNKILLGGSSFPLTTNQDFTVIRYNTDGTLDNSFGINGVAAYPVSGASVDSGLDMALLPDGKIVMVGSTQNPPALHDVALMRLNANGSLDPSFGGSGVVTFSSPYYEIPNSVTIQPDGKIVIGGLFWDTTFQWQQWLLMRFNSNGTPDTSFGSNGMVRAFIFMQLESLDLQADGKIVGVGGDRLARFNSDGSFDNTFGSGGSVSAAEQKVRVLGDGKILGLGSGLYISRYNSNGTLDTTFNGSGSVSVSIPGHACYTKSIAIQSDSKIVVGGSCVSGGINKFAVFRFRESKSPFDFDDDGKTDISIYRPSSGEWWINKSSGGTITAPFGSSSAQITPGDFTGDGKTDIAFWRAASGEWFVLRSEDNSYYSFPFGTNSDIPTVGDFDGDNKADAAVFRPSNARWYISRSSGGVTIQQFGANGDVPVPADYDGDGKADIATFRPSNGQWWINRSTGGVIAYSFGNSSDKPVAGDYTGDGIADIAFWRPASGEWFVTRSENSSFYSFPFGISTDIPAPGDYDGDGKFDAAIFRSSNARWYVNRSTAGILIQTFGQTGDRPVPNAFIP